MPNLETVPAGGQEKPTLPKQPVAPEQQTEQDTVKYWTDQFKDAKQFLEPYFERDQQAFEFWYMWREFRGPYRANIFPPDTHAAIEAVTPRLTKGRPRPIAKPKPGADPMAALRVQHAHDALWDRMDMDQKWETLTKRGTWFGFGVEKVTWRTTGHEEPVMQQVPVLDANGQPTDQMQPQPILGADGKPQTQFVHDYHAPVSEIMDPTRVFFPRGYATEEALPWVCFQYFKKRSELDTSIYDAAKVKGLSGTNLADDPTLERDKVHRLPRKSQVLGQQTNDNLNAPSTPTPQTDAQDPVCELLEFWVRPCKKYPKGLLLTLGDRKAELRKKDNPTPEGDLPLVVFKYIDDTFNLRGVGLAREMERLVLERADKRNQRMDNVSRAIDKMWKLQENEPIEDSELKHQPNGVIRLRDMNNLQDIEQSDVTGSAYQEDALILQDEARATGASEFVVGGGKPPTKTLGEADLLSASSNERYDGVIRRLERSLNRHARLVHLLIVENWDGNQPLNWTDANGASHTEDFDPADFQHVDSVRYDAKSVIAYKAVSRQQGMQLLELTDKLLAGDPSRLTALQPILTPLLELFDEIQVSASDLLKGIQDYAQQKLSASPPPAPPDKILAAIADIVKANPALVTFEQVQQALAMNGITPASAPQVAALPSPPEAGAPGTPPGGGTVLPLDQGAPDASGIVAGAGQVARPPAL